MAVQIALSLLWVHFWGTGVVVTSSSGNEGGAVVMGLTALVGVAAIFSLKWLSRRM